MASIGKPLDRVDGRLKVTGAAHYAAEFAVPGLVHAVLVQSTIAAGGDHRFRPGRRAGDARRAGDHHSGQRAEAAATKRPAPKPCKAPLLQNNDILYQRTARRGRGRRRRWIARSAAAARVRVRYHAAEQRHLDGCGARAGLRAEAFPQRRASAGFQSRRSGRRVRRRRGEARCHLRHADRAPQSDGAACHDRRAGTATG